MFYGVVLKYNPGVISVSSILRHRRQRMSSGGQSLAITSGIGCSLIASLIALLAIIAFTSYYRDVTRDLPSVERLPLFLDDQVGILFHPTNIYDRTSKNLIQSLENPAVRGRRYLSLDTGNSDYLPEPLVTATIGYLDPTFRENMGFSPQGLYTGSHPTLAQLLVSDLLLQDEPPSLRRNIRERVLAAQITSRFGRDKILEWYLNSMKLGHLTYGIDSAVQAYFNKPVKDLTLAEATFLLAISQAPELDPWEAYPTHKQNQKLILDVLQENGMISPKAALQAYTTEIKLQPVSLPPENRFDEYVGLILDQLTPIIGRERLERGGFVIQTSLDYDLQTQATCAIQAQLKHLQGDESGPDTSNNGECAAARLLSTIPPSTRDLDNPIQVGLVAIDPQTGEVLALAGEPSGDSVGLDPHPSGSLITPFIYLTAFSRGMSPSTMVWDLPANLPQDMSKLAIPEEEFHGPVNIRTALANDYLGPAIRVLNQVGPENVWQTTHPFGLSSLTITDLQEAINSYPVLADGEVSLLEIGQAFGVFANQGVLAGRSTAPQDGTNMSASLIPVAVLRVEDRTGKIWVDCISENTVNCGIQKRPVVSPQLAYLLNDILSDETARWITLRHPNPLEIGRPAGAKIGRTASSDSAWTIGYTPQAVLGVWVGNGSGNNESTTQDGISGTENLSTTKLAESISTSLWHALIKHATRNQPPLGWSAPEGIAHSAVCYPSGMIPTAECQTVVEEVFLNGNEPNQLDNLYRNFHINRETHNLATIFTPPELIEEQVFMVIPPFAEEWATSAGYPIPPNAYDIIYNSLATTPDVNITSPGMFSNVHGKVSISGSAQGEDFSYYRLQAGKGLNPQEWLQIGQDNNNLVDKGILGIWDTQSLNGLYALQLLVVYKDQRVETTTIQVTVDNQPPEIEILSPSSDGNYTTDQKTAIILDASANDDTDLDRVEIYMDDKLIGVLRQSPFTLAWKPIAGKHILSVRAYDKAMNTSEATLKFTVK